MAVSILFAMGASLAVSLIVVPALASYLFRHGVRATTVEEIRAVCAEAFKRNGPTVLEVPVLPTIPPLL